MLSLVELRGGIRDVMFSMFLAVNSSLDIHSFFDTNV